MLLAFRHHNFGKPYAEQVKPFGALVSVTIADLGRPVGVGPGPFQLIAPESGDPLRQPWTNLYSGASYRISITGDTGRRGIARVQTFGDVLDSYCRHPEGGTLGAGSEPCGDATRGLLRREPRTVGDIVYTGKESNRLEDVQAGLIGDIGEVSNVYRDPRHDAWWESVLRVLRDMSRAKLERESGLSERAIRDLLASRSTPHLENRRKLERLAISIARQQLGISRATLRSINRENILFEYLSTKSAPAGTENTSKNSG
jgi:hypothetical protein